MNNHSLRYSITASVLALLAVFCTRTYAQRTSSAVQAPLPSPENSAIPAARLLQPEQLVQILHSSSGEKPLILQVGSHLFYAQAHIPGSEYAGAAGGHSGLLALRERVKNLDRSEFLLIYCGCCPWNKCPNIRPAYQQLISMGFTRVKVLYLANNFGTNWVSMGYPVEKGS